MTDKDKESSYLKYCDVNNLYQWAISQKLPVNGFKQVEETSQLKKYLIGSCDEKNGKGYFLEVIA